MRPRTNRYSDYLYPLLRVYLSRLPDEDFPPTGTRLDRIRVTLVLDVRKDWRAGKLTDSDVAHLLDLILDQ